MTEDMRSRVENILNSMLGTVDPADLLPAQSRVEAILMALDSKIDELGDLTAPDETDMTANTNYAVDSFFTVGGTLYKAIAAIATGETIQPGTNCVATSIAEQLTAIYARLS